MPQNISQDFLAQDQATNPGRRLRFGAKLLTQSWSLDLPVAAGTQGQSLRAIVGATPTDIQLEWFTSTSIGDTAVGANLVYAGPASGYPGNPVFRALDQLDIPNLETGKITSGVFAIERLPVGAFFGSVAAGDDPRFHTQNTDTSTTSPTFKLDSTGSGLIIKSTLTGFEFRNASDTDYADFRAGNVVTGNTVEIGDNKVLLNSDVLPTATPTEDGGISLNRGSQAAAEVNWNETAEVWEAGVVGDLSKISRYKIFAVTQAEINLGPVNLAHGYPPYVDATYWMPGAGGVQTRIYPQEETISAPGILTVDFGGIQISGNITVRING